MTGLQQNVLLGVAGIIVTLGTFWLGYRQTFGVRQERVRSANEDLTTTLLKRLVLEDVRLAFDQLESALAGAASQRRLAVSDLWNPYQIGNVLLARVLEDDLISPETRAKLISDWSSASSKVDLPTIDLGAVDGDGDRELRTRRSNDPSVRLGQSLTLVMGVVATAAGSLVALLSSNSLRKSPTSSTVLVTVGVMALTATFAAVLMVYQVRSSRIVIGPVRFDRPGGGDRDITLDTYPDREEGLRSVAALRALSPFAVSALRSLGEDQRRSTVMGVAPGLFVRSGGTPWHKELKQAGLIEPAEPPAGPSTASGREFVVLTEQGREVARLLTARAAIPDYLRAEEEEDASRDGFEHGG
jgi:hypothetical protein